MHVLFTRNNSVFSRLIRAVTREEVSHCGLVLQEHVIHSNLLGLQIDPVEKFLEKSQIIYSVPVSLQEDIYSTLFRIKSDTRSRVYDFGAFLFMGISLFLRHTLELPLPKSNLWRSTGMYLCTELITDILYQREDAMLTPYGLYLKLSNKEEIH